MEWLIDWGPQIAFLGAVIVAVGAWATTQQQDRQQAKYERQIADLHKTVADKSAESAAKSDELAAKSEEIARLTRYSLNTITGGDSFCYIVLRDRESELGATIIAQHHGAFPLRGVAVVIEPMDPAAEGRGRDIEAQRERFTIEHLPVKTESARRQRLPRLTGDSKDLLIRFSTAHGLWSQRLRLRRVDGTWRSASVVHRRDGTEKLVEIYRDMEPGFPNEAKP